MAPMLHEGLPAELEMLARLARSPRAEGSADAWKSEARQLISENKHDAAKLVLEASLESGAPDLDACMLHVQACVESKHAQSHEALRSAHKMLRAAARAGSPGEQQQAALAVAAVHLLAARDLRSEGSEARQAHSAAALRLLQQLVQQQPGDARAQYHLALLLASTGRHDLAVQHTKLALAASAGAGCALRRPSLALLALLLSARSEYQAALAVIDTALDAAAHSRPASSTSNGSTSSGQAGPLGQHEVVLLRIKAAVMAAMGDVSGALITLAGCRRRLTQGEAAPATAEQEAKVWQDLGRLYLAQGLQADAQQCAQQLARLQPHSAEAHCALGAASEAAGDAAGAEECYSAALALEPGHLGAALSLGSLQRRSGTPAGLAAARFLLIGALQQAPHKSAAWREAGLLDEAGGDLDRAEQQLQQAVRLASSEPVLEYCELPVVL